MVSTRTFAYALSVVVLAGSAALSAEGPVVESLNEVSSLRAPKAKGTAEAVDGKSGKAVKLTFENSCRNVYFRSRIKGTPDWDAHEGFSFWVKGDGSKRLGGIQFIWNENYAARYDLAFPIDSTEWKKITVPWSDLIPSLPKDGCNFLGKGQGQNAPGKLSSCQFGKWWYWRDYGGHSYVIDDIRLEKNIDAGPKAKKPAGAPLARVLARLKAKKPVTIVTMGDSLTDYNHWANKPVNWPTLLKANLEAKYGSKVTIVNPAIGGTELRQNLILMPRWLAEAPKPDLVTVCFGYNDWSSGMKGPMFLETHKFGIDRIRRKTGNASDVLIMTTAPAVKRWDTMAEMAQAGRDAAKDRNAGICDIYKAYHDNDNGNKERLYSRDKTHMGPEGHKLIARTVQAAIERGGK